MKKILLLFSNEGYNASLLDFATTMCKTGKSSLIGIFLPQEQFAAAPSVKSIGGQLYVEEITPGIDELMLLAEMEQANIQAFANGCEQREVTGHGRVYSHDALRSIVEETRYADLLIIDPSVSPDGKGKVPSPFTVELLARSECPVLVAPEYFETPEELVFAFDGGRSSMFAIKQFYYLFPSLAEKQIHILHIVEDGKEAAEVSGEYSYFREWLDMHFPRQSFVHLVGSPRELLFEYLVAHDKAVSTILVTGAFGRSLLSMFFKPGAAELVLKTVDMPVFVSHQ